MDRLHMAMEETGFQWTFQDLTFLGKNEKDEYAFSRQGLATDLEDYCVYYFSTYENFMTYFIIEYGEDFYEYLTGTIFPEVPYYLKSEILQALIDNSIYFCKGIEFTEEDCIEVQEKLKEYPENYESLLDHVVCEYLEENMESCFPSEKD